MPSGASRLGLNTCSLSKPWDIDIAKLKLPEVYPAYAAAGLGLCWKLGLLRGQPRGCTFVTTPLFLKSLRLYLFSLVWIPLYCYSPLCAWMSMLYLPSYISLSEYFGGRQSPLVRGGWLARTVRDYFGCRLERTQEIEEPCIMGMHPHGVMPFGSIINLSSNVCNFENLFPRLKNRVVIAATGCFVLPVFRDLILAAGVTDCSRFAVERWIEKKWTVCVFPGGTREALYSNPEEEVLDLTRKRGFIELALKHGVPLVPCYTFNEVDHFSQVSYWDIKEYYPFLMCIRTHFQYLFGIMLPFMKNVLPRPAVSSKGGHVTVVGKPLRLPHVLQPSEAEIQDGMNLYIQALQDLYDHYAPKFSSRPQRKMVIS